MSETVYYKVVSKDNGKLYSPFARPPHRVRYLPGIVITADHPLFVFETLENAAYVFLYQGHGPHFEIWECTVKNPRPAPKRLPDSLFEKDHIDDFWAGTYTPRGRQGNVGVIVDELVLTKRVEGAA